MSSIALVHVSPKRPLQSPLSLIDVRSLSMKVAVIKHVAISLVLRSFFELGEKKLLAK